VLAATIAGATAMLGPLRHRSRQSGADGPHHPPYGFAVIARIGICHVLHFTAGRCVLGGGDTVVSARSARRLGVGAGSVVHTGVPLSAEETVLSVCDRVIALDTAAA
jgi:hypothetical protein